MRAADRSNLSRLLSFALRHRPEQFGLVLDEHGYADIEQLLAVLRCDRRWARLGRAELEELVAADPRGRFQIDGSRIRACYGHSRGAPIQYRRIVPPQRLFHGTSRRAAALIETAGLRSMGRQYVHLSATAELAELVGRRRDEQPVIFTVLARQAHEAGIRFYRANEWIYLVKSLPPQFLVRPADAG